MPLFKLKKVWDYCSYNKRLFILILIIIFLLNLIPDEYFEIDFTPLGLVALVLFIILSSYGMCITRDRINHGYHLPNIVLKDIIYLGSKTTIVYGVYYYIQSTILDLFSFSLNFPEFDLEKLLLNIPETYTWIISQDLHIVLIFFIAGGILFYITTFIMEIGLAKLADTRSLLSAFNLKSIYESISTYGWRNYVLEYTSICLRL